MNVVAPLINQRINANVDVAKKLMFTIWVLAKQESFLAVGDRFGLAKSTGHQIFKHVIYNLAGLMPHYIQWPNAGQQIISSNVCLLFKYCTVCVYRHVIKTIVL